jgi:hypothetical protein
MYRSRARAPWSCHLDQQRTDAMCHGGYQDAAALDINLQKAEALLRK